MFVTSVIQTIYLLTDFFFFCLLVLLASKKTVLKSPTIIVDLSILLILSAFGFIYFCVISVIN